MDDLLQDLTDPQREAVTHMDGPMMVVAGAGSGKTRVVTRRIAHLISHGVWPSQILAMTFTNKAAGEMRDRVEELVGESPRWVGTFHSACARLLRQDLSKLGEERTGDFTIFDDTDQKAVVKQCIKDLGVETEKLNPADVLGQISRAKCQEIPPERFGYGYGDDDLVARIYGLYETKLCEMNALDFDDLLIQMVRLLDNCPHVRDMYHARFRYLLVDEYQDTNSIQYRLLELLTGPDRNVHVTGDPDQSIYSWRGAEYQNIDRFLRDFSDARVVRLEQNYRSTQTILTAANELIRFNTGRMEKELFTDNGCGEPITVVRTRTDREEATWVCERIANLHFEGVPLREMAIFYRTNAQSRAFEESLMRVGLPYQIVGGIRFYQRKEVKDLLAHLKLLANPRDMVSLQRILDARPTGVGQKTLTNITAQANEMGMPVFSFLCQEHFTDAYAGRASKKLAGFAEWCRELSRIPFSPVSDCVGDVLEVSGLVEHARSRQEKDPSTEDRIENMKALVNRAAQFEEDHPDAGLLEFLEDVSLVADVDSWDNRAESLSLMTLHSAKGLEFPYVFLVGAEQNFIPHQNAQDVRAVEEERRLFYVGITRAEKELAITCAKSRYMWGESLPRQFSPFLEELPQDVLDVQDLSTYCSDW